MDLIFEETQQQQNENFIVRYKTQNHIKQVGDVIGNLNGVSFKGTEMHWKEETHFEETRKSFSAEK